MTDRLQDFNGAILQTFPKVVPHALKFPHITVGTPIIREEVRINPERETYSRTKNQFLTLRLPNTHFWDCRRAYLLLDLSVSAQGGTYLRIAQGIWTLFQRWRVLYNRREIEDRFEYGRLTTILYTSLQDYNIAKKLESLYGIGSAAEREANAATLTRYVVPLDLTSLMTTIMPAKCLKTYIELEGYLNDPFAFFETDGTDPDYTISNIDWHVERLTLSPGLYARYKSEINSKGLMVHFNSFRHYLNNFQSRSADLKIEHASDSVNYILNCFVPEAEQNVLTIDDKYLKWEKVDQINYQARVNARRYPEAEIDTSDPKSVEPYMIYLKWGDWWKQNGRGNQFIPISVEDFNTDKYLWILDFRAHPGENSINPFGTRKANVDIIITTKHNSVPAQPYQVHHFVNYGIIMQILPNGTIKRLE